MMHVRVCVCVPYESAFACSLARGGARPCPAPLCIGLMTRRNVNQTPCKHRSMYTYVYEMITQQTVTFADSGDRKGRGVCVCLRIQAECVSRTRGLYCRRLWLCLFVLQKEKDHLRFQTPGPGAQKKAKHMVLHTCTHIPTCKLHYTCSS